MKLPFYLMVLKEVHAVHGNFDDDNFKYVVYSAHDDTVLNLLRFFDLDYDWIPFASTLTFELKYSEQCLHESQSATAWTDPGLCFGVSILRDGVP